MRQYSSYDSTLLFYSTAIPAYGLGSHSTLADGNTNYSFRDSFGDCSTYSFLVLLTLLFMVFSPMCVDQYLIKDLKVPLHISRALCLCVSASSLIICFTHFSCLGLPKHWNVSSTHQDSLSLFGFPITVLTFPSQVAGELDELNLFVFLLSGITVL